MSDKVSGFGWCSGVLGHKYVGIYKGADDRYYVKIDYYRSTKTFGDLNDIKGVWECVAEVERDIIELQAMTRNDRRESKLEGGGSVCPEPPLR